MASPKSKIKPSTQPLPEWARCVQPACKRARYERLAVCNECFERIVGQLSEVTRYG